MPPVVAAVAGYVVASAPVVVGFLGPTGAMLLGSLVATGINYAIASSQQRRPKFDDTQSRKFLVRGASEPWRIIYGEAEASGVLAFGTVTGDDPKYLHLVIGLTGREIESVEEIYLNDVSATDDRWFSSRRFRKAIATVSSGKLIISGTRWEDGDVVKVGDVIKINAGLFGNVGVYKIIGKSSVITPGQDFGDGGVNPDTITMTLTLDSPLTGGGSASGNDHDIRIGYVRINSHLGDPDQAADADMVSEVPEWTNDHRLRGRAYLYVRLRQSVTVFPTGIPNIKARVKGCKVYDPRTGATAWSDNAALCARDYLTWQHGIGASASEIDESYWIAAANVCDELVAVDALGTTETRYTVNGSLRLDQLPLDTLEQLAFAMGGSVLEQAGQWRAYAGAAEPSTASIGPDDLRAGVQVIPKPGRDERFNAVRGLAVDPDRNWEATDFPPVTNTLYETEDGGERTYRDLELPWTIGQIRPQRIAKIVLETHRQGIVATLPLKLGPGIALRVGQVIDLTLAPFGWAAKLFRVRSWSMVEDRGGIGIDVVVQEYAAESYDWAYGEATLRDPAPNTALPNPAEVGVPMIDAIWSGTTQLLQLQDGTVLSRIQIDYTPPAGRLARVECQYRPSGEHRWLEAAAITPDVGSIWISDVIDGQEYTIRLRAINSWSIPSEWSDDYTHTVIGKTAPPADVASLSAVVTEAGVRLSWPAVADLDLLEYAIRVGADWATGIEVARARSTSAVLDDLSAGSRTYWIKAIDTGKRESAAAASASVSIDAPVAPAAEATISGELVRLTWSAPAATLGIARYEIRIDGTGWADATPLATTDALTYAERVTWSSRTYRLRAVDSAGNAGAVATVEVSINVPTVDSLTSQVIDNNVLLYWSVTPGALPVATAEVRRGAVFSTATVIGEKSGTFTSVFETVAGSYTYWVRAKDTAGNWGPERALTTFVDEPPDYVLQADIDSDWSGTKTNALLQDGSLWAPVNTTETVAQHFTNNSWAGPADQIAAGYSYWIMPTPATASYVEVVDYGTTIPTSKITLAWTTGQQIGSVTVTPTISVSTDGVSWTDHAGVSQLLASNFRYVKATLDFAGDGGSNDLLELTGLNIKLSVKLKSDAGSGTASAGDSGGTSVSFGTAFIDVSSITVTPKGTSGLIAVYDFTDVPNPTGFSVYLFNASGTRVSGDFSWSARGY